MRSWLWTAIGLSAVGCLSLLGGLGAFNSFDRMLQDSRFSLADRAATGNVVVVAIDSPSIAEIGVWPWPRRLHAEALDALLDKGAADVAFDIDFSSASNPGDDQIFAEALERAGGFAWLGAFEQLAGGTNYISLPLARFLEQADAASVNVALDGDGLATRIVPTLPTAQGQVPALAAILSRRADLDGADPGIDFGIDATGIDQISFVDVLRGRVAEERIRDKQVIIGATAVELRDIFAVPHYGVMAGPVLQALATETLLQHRELRMTGWAPAGGIAAAFALVLGLLRRRRTIGALLAAGGAVTCAVEIGALAAYASSGWLVSTATFHMAVVALLGIELARVAQDEARRRDIAQRRLTYLASHDPVTGALSRTGLIEALGPTGNDGTALLVAVHRLDQVRATLGGDVADAALAAIAARLGRVSDARLAYIAEDLFCLHFDRRRSDDAIEELCRDIEIMAGGILRADDRPVLVALSFGFAHGWFHRGALLRAAEAALMHGQRSGLNIAGFAAGQADALQRRRNLSVDFHQAIDRGQLRLVYQPQFDLRAGGMVGVEALMRWQHPELGAVPPGEFIPLAEESGDMIRLGRWALLTACHDVMQWHWTGRVAVNVSPSQLQNTDLVADIEHALRESGLNPARLEIELTEGTVLRDIEAAQALASALHDRGIGLALDDFGTGYSALSHLTALPFDTIKIDQSFVRRMDQTTSDRSLLESIVAMGKALDKIVLAEGIETAAQLDALRLAGCDIGQGYHLGRPMEASAIAALLNAGAARSA